MESATIGIVGLGLLGRGIAACFRSRGFRVVGCERDPRQREQAENYIVRALKDLVEHECMSAERLQTWRTTYLPVEFISSLGDCHFVIESIFEDLQAKQCAYDEIEAVIRPTVPIASNTSALPITKLQNGRRHPNRFIGMHWADPCHVTRFLEITRGEHTDDATVDTTMRLAKAAGKDPSLVNKDVDGFIVNRIAYAMYREAFHLLESGVADVETIDRTCRNVFGIWASIVGPFQWMDLSGLPAYAAVMKRLFPKLSNSTDLPEAIRKLVENGAQGIRNGQGFYNYSPEEARRWEQRLMDNVWRLRQIDDASSKSGDPKCD